MGFIQRGGFVFKLSGPAGNLLNGMGDSYHNDCVPETVGVGNKIPVTVRVIQAQGVTQAVTQTQSQGASLSVTVQQSVLWLPQQQQVQNPVRQRQIQGVFATGQEVAVAQIPVENNSALSQFEQQGTSTGVTVLVPILGKANEAVVQAIPALGKEITVALEASATVTDDVAQAVSKGITEGQQLANKLRGANPATIQQALQKVGVGFSEARNITNAVTFNNPALGEMLERIGASRLREFQQQIAQSAARTAVRVCAI